MNLLNVQNKYNEIANSVKELSFCDTVLSPEFKKAFTNFIAKGNETSFSIADWALYSAKITTKKDKQIFLPNFWFFLGAKLADFLDTLEDHRNVFQKIYSETDLKTTSEKLRTGIQVTDKESVSYTHLTLPTKA